MPVFEQNQNATSVKVPLDRKKIWKKTIESVLGSVLLIAIFGWFIGVFAIQFIGLICIPIGIILFVAYIFVMRWYQTLYYENYYYDIKDDALLIRKGVWFKSQISFNFSKIQDVYIDQDMFDKFFGLYDVHFATAAITSANLAHIDGLNEDNAVKVRDQLLEKLKKYGSNGKGSGV